MARRQIKMNEEKLRNFISYSVAKLLKEENMGIMTHFEKPYEEEPEEDFGDETYDEYLERKNRENAEHDEMREREPDMGGGLKMKFPGHETVEPEESDYSIFDTEDMANKGKIKLNQVELQEMIRRAINEAKRKGLL